MPSPEEIAREKYEAMMKSLQQNYDENMRYLDMVIANIDKNDLINAMEKPIDVDPLKKLA